jgi:hypothetical protein
MRRTSDEQELVRDMNTARAALPTILEAAGPSGHRLTSGVFDATQHAVAADLHFREAERVEALGLDPSRAATPRTRARFRNQACLDSIDSEVMPAIDNVRREFGDQREIDATQAFDFFEVESRELLAQMDLNRSRATTAGRVLAETRATANEAGIAGLCDLIEGHMSRLADLRREREEHNGPIAVAIGGALAATGFLIYGICSALSGGRPCTNSTVTNIAEAFWTAGGILILIGLGSGRDIDEGGSGPMPSAGVPIGS